MDNLIAKKLEEVTNFHVMALLNKAKQLEKQGRDIIHMEIGEPDFPTPEAVVKAAQNFLAKGDIKYTSAAGLPELRQHIADYYAKHYSVTVGVERIFITPGASGAILLAMAATMDHGDEILLTDPGYPCNANLAHLLNAKAIRIPVHDKESFHMTARLIEQYWGKRCKGVLIASPSNPTGTVIDSDILQEIIQVTHARKGVFFSDEIYHGLVYGDVAETALTYSDQVFVINSFSKYFGMTGWRVGWIIVPEGFIEVVEKLSQNIFIAASTLSQVAAVASFDENNLKQLEARKMELQERRNFLLAGLRELGFSIEVIPQGAFYIYAKCSMFTENSFQFALELLEQEGVAVTPGVDFGNNKEKNYIRFAYTAPIDRISEALSRIGRFTCR